MWSNTRVQIHLRWANGKRLHSNLFNWMEVVRYRNENKCSKSRFSANVQSTILYATQQNEFIYFVYFIFWLIFFPFSMFCILQLVRFWQQLLADSTSNFTARGMCTIDRTILTSVCSDIELKKKNSWILISILIAFEFQFSAAICTYLVILIQFQRSDK